MTKSDWTDNALKTKEVKARFCARCRKEPPMWGHAVCKDCFPKVPVRKPIEETLAMIDEVLNGLL